MTKGDVGKVILAGSSWGYKLALLYTYIYPEDVKAIILTGTVAWHGQGKEQNDCSYYAPDINKAPYFGKEDSVSYMSFNFFQPPSKNPELLDAGGKEKFIEMHDFSFYFTRASLQEAPLLRELNKIQVPVLAFQAIGCNQTINKDATHQLIGVLPGLEVYPIQGACHDPWYTHFKEFFNKCIQFIRVIK